MSTIDNKALYNLSYGLFVLSAKGGKENGCIINTAMQVTSNPLKISICINKSNYTLDMIIQSGKFNISVLSQDATFDIFKHFGFQTGKKVNKFPAFNTEYSSNGVPYINEGANAYFSAEVDKYVDLGTHVLIIANVTESKVLSATPSITYAYYQSNVKPKPKAKADTNNPNAKKVWVCKICGYVYDDNVEKVPFEDLPDTWVCPLCKHPKSDFELQK